MTQNTSATTLGIRAELEALAEEKYRQFVITLIPNCDNILGVRIPIIRKFAKQIIKQNPLAYLEDSDEKYFEEVMLKGLIIGNLKADNGDIKLILQQVKNFIPKISNWSLCDSFCCELKLARKYKSEFWQFMQPYFHSDKTYDIRFAVVMGLFHLIEPDYLDLMFKHFNHISRTDPNRDYYVKMGVAWAVSMCYVKHPVETMSFLQNNQLDNETHNKALQKIRESHQVDKPTKDIMQKMKRKS